MSTLKTIKREFRVKAFNIRSTLPIKSISKAILDMLQTLTPFQEASHVLFYHPFQDELDLLPLVERYPQKKWFLPRIQAGDQLSFHQISDAPLIPNRFGIPEPPPENPEWLPGSARAVVIVPGLMFDRSGNRLGYGKGFYDRWLVRHRNSITTVGAIPEALLTDQLPVEAWDIPTELIVTERQVFRTPTS